MPEILEAVQEYTPIWNINRQKRQIRGVFALEARRKTDGRVMDFEESLPYFLKWFGEINNATEGKSWGNVREQHTMKNVGKIAEEPYIDYQNKQIFGVVEVSDDPCWTKIENGEYCAFSWGGNALVPSDNALSKWKTMLDGNRRYVGQPLELTITDNPNQEGTYFKIVSNSAKYTFTDENGNTEEREFKIKENEMTNEEIQAAITNAATAAATTATQNLTTIIQETVTNSVTTLKDQLVTDITAQVKKDMPAGVTEDQIKKIVDDAVSANNTVINNSIEGTVKKVLETLPAPNGVKQTGEPEKKDTLNIEQIENSTKVKLTDGEKAALELIHNMNKQPVKKQ